MCHFFVFLSHILLFRHKLRPAPTINTIPMAKKNKDLVAPQPHGKSAWLSINLTADDSALLWSLILEMEKKENMVLFRNKEKNEVCILAQSHANVLFYLKTEHIRWLKNDDLQMDCARFASWLFCYWSLEVWGLCKEQYWIVSDQNLYYNLCCCLVASSGTFESSTSNIQKNSSAWGVV